MLLYKDLSDKVLQSFFTVHKSLGPGLLEGPYHNALYYHLRKQGLHVGYQVPFSVSFEGHVVGESFADLVVENKIIVEVKAVKILNEIMSAQLINYLRLSGSKVGYLVNFKGLSVDWKRFVLSPP